VKDILDEMIAAAVKKAVKDMHMPYSPKARANAALRACLADRDVIAKERVAEREAAAVKRAEIEAELAACKAALAIKVEEIASLIDAASKAAPPMRDAPEWDQLDLPIAGIEAAPDTGELL